MSLKRRDWIAICVLLIVTVVWVISHSTWRDNKPFGHRSGPFSDSPRWSGGDSQ
jgi:hypothetical protein